MEFAPEPFLPNPKDFFAPEIEHNIAKTNKTKVCSGYDYAGQHRTINGEVACQNQEKDRIKGRLTGFDTKNNIAWHEITSRFGENVKQQELLSIANVLSLNANIKLDRDAKRRKSVLIKWFNENWTVLAPFLQFVVLDEAFDH
ncbi:hypothetical protein TVAG_210840 [Trichomonas vaginalis G3]|uniref:Uncharacterized protein n=1 Tax=Trichomonas vaginalis (strain ATCC PRA-98 / G3) TaxID=412133 RepID=A2F870_TRIV3|nr:hypothetical protein TVAGG3_0736630 [Trichomonas vaginalis G3]EAX98890.1 hypothetical protein TVAG_210840 [Trichomonas vaginalis G3]KAI5511626.1 hypothetical protein TVAGG3_0736630 [Trichomonas vaginalis G3]|eukprot:XP_001311820.1 hypothetical protein [Trichomonas vaginalis G3]